MKKVAEILKNNIWILISFLINAVWVIYFAIHSWYNLMPSADLHGEEIRKNPFNSTEIIYKATQNKYLTLCIMSIISFIVAFCIGRFILKNKDKTIKVICTLVIQIVFFILIYPLTDSLIARAC
jgi:hypothetical protein